MKKLVINIFIIFLILSCFFNAGCSNIIMTKPWSENEFIGMRMELVDDFHVENFSFFKDGHVLATIGTKDVLTGPILYWGIDFFGNLIIKDDNFRFTLKKVSKENNFVEVLCNGKKAKYNISKI